jgi:hypothetical protein
MDFVKLYSREIVSLLVPVLTAVLAWVMQRPPKVIWSIHNLRFFLAEETVAVENGPPQKKNHAIRAASVFVQNSGRMAAQGVEIVFNWRPQHFNVWPQREYVEILNPDGRFIVKLSGLGPKEFLGIDVLTINAELPDLIQVRSGHGAGTRIQMHPQQIHPRWKLLLAACLMFVGFVALLWALIALLQFILASPYIHSAG